jgi:hypothetical protein
VAQLLYLVLQSFAPLAEVSLAAVSLLAVLMLASLRVPRALRSHLVVVRGVELSYSVLKRTVVLSLPAVLLVLKVVHHMYVVVRVPVGAAVI